MGTPSHLEEQLWRPCNFREKPQPKEKKINPFKINSR